MIWSNIKNLLFGLLLEEICQEIMQYDHVVNNRTLLDCRKSLFSQVEILEFFQTGEPYEFSPKLKNYSLVSFWKKYA